MPDEQVSLQVNGKERVRWHFAPKYQRPFFFPFNGPSGETLTRMGHPGVQNHDHHRSVWWAHAKVDGENFWADSSKARIRQKMWLAYADGDEEAMMATSAGWYSGEGKEILEQEMVASVRPGPDGETFLELQSTFTPTGKQVTLEQSNFGFLAVRMAKGIATYWGEGEITSSEGVKGEPQIFGQSAAWMDYSGRVPRSENGRRVAVTEGITYFDHEKNPSYPSHWHVREDGWMGASLCRHE
ncbi:MAG: PmoA family protein, partial [Verrucomicrobiota bacterium]|nr:PmoA family protein [Verrucomicrobiota bacterium]